MTVTISASQVKELRERTGAGMMECKKALAASGGDMERAIEELRKAGVTKAGKKAGRIAAEGAVAILDNGKRAVMVEINSETDFVARDNNFTAFVKAVAETALNSAEEDVSRLSGLPLQGYGKSVEESRQELVSKVGENVQIRRIVLSQPSAVSTGTYLHGSRIGVIVELDTDNKDLARDVAMHIAASKPVVVSPDNVSKDIIEKEKEIYMAQAANSGKPQDIIEKMVLGRLKKYLDEISLTGQPFVKDPDTTVGSLLNKHRAKVLAFYRYEVGEGIEKVTEDFKEAVMSQVQGG
ncbi:Elongation factor Ts [Aquicella siphonis]|uniref:Elongation factor Ts n=1 Tax=Aquicella siphonis TaxID=254247 RepID=A0A5E4PED0_9COXI|nr:translation elongation factor Ts [Aquicella siphonis]VVC75320.1 Elongation factor Ts [Aquicella siphonis]